MILETMLSEWMQGVFAAALEGTPVEPGRVTVVATADGTFGDYQCNAAMGLGRVARRKPVEIASLVKAKIDLALPDFLERVEVAGPGFLNLYLRTDWLVGVLDQIAVDSRHGVPRVGEGRTVLIDYSSPNVAKPMHIGHIRSTVIGNALDRCYRFLGYRVIADNHIGDWGTQFGILILGYRNFLDRDALRDHPIEELERLYVKSYEQARQTTEWMDQARQELVKLQAGDPENRRLWTEFIQLSLAEFETIYRRLDVKFDLIRGESYYHDQLAPMLARVMEAGIARESEGALVAFLEEEKLPPAIVRKSDGAFNYAATDVATVLSRVAEFNPDRIVYVTDERQQLHFKQFFAICRRLGVTVQLEHVWFGLMRLPEGTFSTRQGNVIKLDRLLDEAEARAAALVKELTPEMEAERQAQVARAVGIGAVKYADLSQNPQSLVTFSWDKALSMNGNSAPYLQYAYARMASLRDKYRERFPEGKPETFSLQMTEPVERVLALALVRFPETLIRAVESSKPSLLADYLYNLAGTYSTFYQNVPVLKAEAGVRESRVRLGGAVADVLRTGLNLLGIEAPERI